MTIVTERTAPADYVLKDIDLIDPSPLNPRKTFDQARLEELKTSIVEAGIIEPLIVRPGKKDRVELVAGERRFRAAKMAGLVALPCIVRYLTDVQVLTLMAIENEQRDDIHPLERAAGYAALMKADAAYTPERIAKGIGKSKRWVQLCLQYLTLIPPAQEYFRDGKITAGHADLIVRLKPEDQKKALEACFQEDPMVPGFFELGEYGGKRERLLVSVRELDKWVAEHVRLPLDASSPQLDLLPSETREAIAAAAAPNAPTLLELVDSYYAKDKQTPAPLTREHWQFVKKGEKCPPQAQQRGVIVMGRNRGRVLTVCTGKGACPIHWAATLPKPKAEKGARGAKAPKTIKSAAELKYEKERAQERERDKLWDDVKASAVKLARARASKLTDSAAAAFVLHTIDTVGSVMMPKKRPTTLRGIAQLLVDDNIRVAVDLADFEYNVANPLGINLKPLFAAAAPAPAKQPATKKRPTLGKGK